MSIWKKVGNFLKKAAAPALGLAGAAFGAPALGSAIGGLFSAKSDPGMGDPNTGPQPESVQVSAPKMGFWDKYGGDIIQAGVPAISGALGYFGQRTTNAANAQMAQKQMDFQAQQNATAYQRGTADMKAAGLNPMLAYSQGGAGSGSGATATMGNELGSGANSALDAAQTMASLKNMFAQNDFIQSQTENMKSQTRSTDVNTLNQIRLEPEFQERGKSAFLNTRQKAVDLQLKELEAYMVNNMMNSTIASAKATADYNQSRAKAADYGLSRAKAESDWWKDEGLFAGGYHSLARNEVRENVSSGAEAVRDLMSFRRGGRGNAPQTRPRIGR